MALYGATVYPPSTRNVQGKGAGKEDHRSNDEMRINLKRAYADPPFIRGTDVNENLTIGEFVCQAVRDVASEEGFQSFQQGWYVEIQSFGKPLDPYENVGMLKERFNGAETVHAKVFNEYGQVLTYTPGFGWH
ncbi:hypothetical protein DFH06DRAFT_1205634 [Mycena polygramma]|nr:hypothetical protein DFH06DRAFT_1205634 [Mycena polygramma]